MSLWRLIISDPWDLWLCDHTNTDGYNFGRTVYFKFMNYPNFKGSQRLHFGWFVCKAVPSWKGVITVPSQLGNCSRWTRESRRPQMKPTPQSTNPQMCLYFTSEGWVSYCLKVIFDQNKGGINGNKVFPHFYSMACFWAVKEAKTGTSYFESHTSH